MGKQRSLRSKAVNLVSDFTTVLLNPISDKPSKKPPPGDEAESERGQAESIPEEGSSVDGPDTSSFTAFLYSLLKDDYFSADRDNGQPNNKATEASEAELGSELEIEHNAKKTEAQPVAESGSANVSRESGGRRGLLLRGKQTVSKAMSYAARLAWYRNQASQKKPNSVAEADADDKAEGQDDGGQLGSVDSVNDQVSMTDLPDMSEPSMLLSPSTRMKLYASLPSLVKGRKWVLLYSTWRHGISLSTLYRKSKICPGQSLLVVGDEEGAVFGGLVEAPLKPNTKKKYQGSIHSFLFTDAPGQPMIYSPTGANRYYTLCSPDFLALGGGRHFALYLDNDLLLGSSAASETYGNPCLSLSEDFKVKDVELWGFAYASRYDEMLALSQNEPPGICRW